MPCCPVDGWWLHRCPTRTASNENSDHDRCFWWKITDCQRRVLNFYCNSPCFWFWDSVDTFVCMKQQLPEREAVRKDVINISWGGHKRWSLSMQLKKSRVNWGTHQKHCYHNAIWLLERCGLKWIAVLESQVQVCQYLYIILYYISFNVRLLDMSYSSHDRFFEGVWP